VRALVILAAAAAVFTLFVLRTHQRAGQLVEAENAAAAHARELAAAPPGPPVVEGGYRFEWVTGGGLPAILVARPERRGEDGVCHFAALPDGTVYAFDTVRRLADDDRPDVTPLRVHVAQPPEDRGESAAPGGWQPLG